ncbi:MAG: methyltransferase [Alistipes sp.]|nr:methyltransferase [Alistipes sp.]
MLNYMFRFKQFTVHQQRSAMKVGTDGVLIGAWASVRGTDRAVLDIGTGTGLIALMIAQRNPKAEIVAVEIDAESAEQARENVAASPWSNRIRVEECAVQEFVAEQKFDLFVSNPPYFVDSFKCSDESRNTARHTDTLSFVELMRSAERLLAPDGRFAVIVPSEAALSVIAAGRLHLVRRCDVRSKPKGSPKRVMLEFSPRFEGAAVREEMTIGDGSNGGYSPEYIALTRDFYLKFE